MERRTDRARTRLQHAHRRGLLPPGQDGDTGLDDPGLFHGDRLERVAQHVLVVEADRRDHRQRGRHDVGRVEAAAKAGLEHGDADLRVGERERAQGERRLEEGATRAGRHGRNAREALRDCRGRGRAAVDPDALAVVDEMRRGEEAGAPADPAQHALEERRGRALAVRPRDVDRPERFLGPAQVVEQRTRALEAERPLVAALEAVQPLERLAVRIGRRGHGHGARTAGLRAGRGRLGARA